MSDVDEVCLWLRERLDRGSDFTLGIGSAERWFVLYEHAGAPFYEDGATPSEALENARRHIAERFERYGGRQYPHTQPERNNR